MLDHFQRSHRPQESDEDLPGPQEAKVGFACGIIGAVTKDLNNGIGGAEHGTPVGKNLRALFEVLRVGITRFHAGASFNYHFKTGLDQIRNHHGDQPDAPLAGITLSRNTDRYQIVFPFI